VIPSFLWRGKFRAVLYMLLGRYRELENREHLYTLDFRELVGELLRAVYDNVDPDEVDYFASLIEAVFFRYLKLYSDAVPFLEGLKKLGARVVLITDSSTRWQRKKIEVLGIGSYFSDVIISGETGHSKLEVYNFRLALERFPDDEIYVVGDRDDTDMRGGRSIGATTILIRRGYYRGKDSRNADYVVRSLREALEVIESEHKKRAKA